MIRSSSVTLAVLALVGLAASTLVGCRRPAQSPATGGAAAVAPTPVSARIVLFFPGDDALLHREFREVPDLPDLLPSRVRTVVGELLAGSREGYPSPFPWPATLDAVFVDGEGNAFLDFSAPPAGSVHGTTTEMALAYATVDTVAANCTGIARVQLLFGGREVSTFGHLDLSRPLAPAVDLVAP